MTRTQSLCFFSALVGLVAACGKVVVDPIDNDGLSGGSSSSAGGSGGAAATTGGSGETGGETTGGGGMCNLPPPPTPTVPDQPGCYFNDMGTGWVSVPCDCDLWLANTTHAPINAGIQLTVTPPDEVPTLTGPLDVEMAFDDPDASWYATWSKQVGSGEAFTVASEGGTTTVRMGQSSVTLMPVPVAACKTSKSTAHVFGSSSATLSAQAVLDDGSVVTMTCSNPPPV